jgi:dTDP-4-dehydrorhamnose reductase
MKRGTALITGLNGTVAPVLAAAWRSRGGMVTGWDRGCWLPDDPGAVDVALDAVQPAAVFHLAMGAEAWAGRLAAACAARGIPFVYTGTVSVFSGAVAAPIGPDAPPDATDDYGAYKRRCEEAIRATGAPAVVARIGWQIGEGPGSNNMVDFLCRRAADSGGVVAVNERWTPSCALLVDTAEALIALHDRGEAGVYHVEGNPGWSMLRIAEALNRRHGFGWTVRDNGEPSFDNRMQDARVVMRMLDATLA